MIAEEIDRFVDSAPRAKGALRGFDDAFKINSERRYIRSSIASKLVSKDKNSENVQYDMPTYKIQRGTRYRHSTEKVSHEELMKVMGV